MLVDKKVRHWVFITVLSWVSCTSIFVSLVRGRNLENGKKDLFTPEDRVPRMSP